MLKFPPFQPHPLFRSGHAQTLVAAWWPGARSPFTETQRHHIPLPDGDQLVLHDDSPRTWMPGDGAALLVHGLCGCHSSGYMQRIARKLVQRDIRVFRLDLRGCGAGRGLARQPYHAGRSEDVQAAVEEVSRLCDRSRLSVAGFSLGGNIVLKWAGEVGADPPANLRRVMAVNPPVDLAASTEEIARTARGFYDRHFSRLLLRQVSGTPQWNPAAPLARAILRPRTILDFDESFTAPLAGYRSAAEYYELCSASGFVPAIRLPTLILTAADDPLVPFRTVEALDLPASVRVHVEPSGGHLGYLAGTSSDPDRRWMDWRVLDWLAGEAS